MPWQWQFAWLPHRQGDVSRTEVGVDEVNGTVDSEEMT